MKEGIRLQIKESLEFRNSRMAIQMTMRELAILFFPGMKEEYAIKTLSCWNNGTYTPVPTPEDVARLSQIIGVSSDFLVGITSIPARELINEEFASEFGAMIRVLKDHYNEDEHPVLKKSIQLWKQLNLKFSS